MEQLQREILQHFPARLGHITPVAAGAFPLHVAMRCSMPVKGWRWWAMRRTPFTGGAGREPRVS